MAPLSDADDSVVGFFLDSAEQAAFDQVAADYGMESLELAEAMIGSVQAWAW